MPQLWCYVSGSKVGIFSVSAVNRNLNLPLICNKNGIMAEIEGLKLHQN